MSVASLFPRDLCDELAKVKMFQVNVLLRYAAIMLAAMFLGILLGTA